jgi:uncharacterized protein DUF222
MSKSGKPFDESQYQASAGPELIAKIQDLSRQIRVLEAAKLDLIAEMDRLGIAALAGYSNTRALLIEVLRVAPRLATKLVQRSAVVAETLTPTGHVTPAPLPTVRAALHEGLLDGEHIDAVAETVKEIPDTADYATRELVEATLGETARTVNPKVVAEHGAIMLQHLDPDGLESGEEPPQPMNSLTCRRSRDGSLKFAGQLDPESADLLEQMLVTLGKPRPLSDDIPDPRSVRERHGDALSEIVHRAANPKGVTKARLTVTLDHDMLMQGVGTATLSSGCPSPRKPCGASPATPASSPSSSTGNPSRSMSVDPAGWSNPPNEPHWSPATRGAPIPDAASQRNTPTLTTSVTGPTAGPLTWITWCCCAGCTT